MKKSYFIAGQFLFPVFVLLFAISATKVPSTSKKSLNVAGIEGRWDITIQMDGKEFPSWLEVMHSGRSTLVGQFVGVSGSARPISRIDVEGNKIMFSIPPQWENGENNLKVEGTLEGDKLSGSMKMPDGKIYDWMATRAPSLKMGKEPTWGTPIKLFNGKDLDGWQALGTNQWVAEAGVLKSPKSGANLRTTRTFNNFKLHIEFRYPKGSNSGVYLRGRYEVQISDSQGMEPSKGDLGSVYGFITPTAMVAKAPGEWQYYDITLVGRMLSVVANGRKIICDQEIPGITGGALDSKEGEPGPIYLQGDHGPIEYRNIILTPAR